MAKILVVDDEKSIRVTLSLFLENQGHEVQMAGLVDEALQLMHHFKPDLVLTDIIMPHISGVELLETLRNQSPDIAVIIMTGEPTVETAIQALQLEASDYLSKPIQKETILRVVSRVLEVKKLRDEKKKLEEENLSYQKNLESIVRQRTSSLFKASESIIKLLARVTEYRDPYTAGHQVRVGNLAADIAQALGLSQSQVEDVRIIGYIHDIGKIVVPAEILAKPGALTHAERQLIQSHAESGKELLSDVKLPQIYADAVYEHHERYDGTGYPRGLKNGQIHIETHVLIVADVVEAMISHRPYRAALGQEEALHEIQSKAGSAYHPEVVKACLSLFNDQPYEIDNSTHELMIDASTMSRI